MDINDKVLHMNASPLIYQEDLPHTGHFFDVLASSPWIAVDTETTGLHLVRDRVLLVQMALADGSVHMVRIQNRKKERTRLASIMSNPDILKIFHYARFDMAMLQKTLNVEVKSVFCTKIASKLVRTYTQHHGLFDLCKELLQIELDKSQQSSDWAKENLEEAQYTYAANDVVHLYSLREQLLVMLRREGREDLAMRIFAALQVRVDLDLAGWEHEDIFAHR